MSNPLPIRAPMVAPTARRPLLWLAAALLAAGIAGGAAAQTPIAASPLTLEAALRTAETRSHTLEAQDAAARSAREMAVAAGRLPDPMLRLSIDNLPTDGASSFSLTEDFMTQRSLGVTQTFTREGKRQARSARFEREADAAQAMHGMQLTVVRRQTAQAWFDRYYQQQLVDLLVQQRDEAALQIDAATAAYRAGRGAQVDVFAAQAALARIDDRIREARAGLANAGTSLARWVGDAASAPLGEAPPIAHTRLASGALASQFDRHPDIALMASKEALAQAEAEVARQDKTTDWTVSVMYSQRGPAYSNMLTLGVSLPLQWDRKNRQDRELAAKLAKAEQVRAEREEATRERMAQTQRWLATWQSNLARLDDYDTTLIPLAGERTRATLAAYRGGKTALAAVLDARRMEIDTRVERLRIEMETAALWAELEFLMPATPSPEQSQ